MCCIEELQGKLQNKKENLETQGKRELRAGEAASWEKKKEEVGTQDKLENENLHIECTKESGIESQGVLGSWCRENQNLYQEKALIMRSKIKILSQKLT